MIKLYKLSDNDVILKDLGNNRVMSMPMTDGNKDYERYKLWLADGNTPEPADATPEIVVTPHKGKSKSSLSLDNRLEILEYKASLYNKDNNVR